jgi:Ferritin-like
MLLVRSMPLDSQKAQQTALQYAIELEHATIPPYLTALYSLQPGKNDAIAGLIGGIVFQEMQHMARAANILNAIDGQPQIDNAAFLPHYPGGLPFHIGDRNGQHFDVPLKGFTLDLVHDVFMRIEEPEEPINFPVGTRMAALVEQQYRTIGDFYRAVRAALKAEWFTGDGARQVKGIVNPVYTLADAQAAIDLIVEQGEGTTTSPLSGMGDQLAHYYRFAEIFHQRTLVPDNSVPEKYSYSGAPIPFDPGGVLPIAANPTSKLYPPGSKARVESDVFNQIYSNLLRALDITFNGQPDYLDSAIGLMFDLKLQAIKLMNIPIDANTNAAPCYEYVSAA